MHTKDTDWDVEFLNYWSNELQLPEDNSGYILPILALGGLVTFGVIYRNQIGQIITKILGTGGTKTKTPVEPPSSTATYATMPRDVITVKHKESLSLSTFTLSCWFRTSKDYTKDKAGYMITKGSYNGNSRGNNINYALLISTDVTGYNALEVVYNPPDIGSSGNDFNCFSKGAVNDGKWHYAVGTYDGRTLKLYLDGKLVDTTNATKTPDTGTHPLIIGGHEGWFTYNGDLDEVRIWNIALTAAEISDLYNNGTVPKTANIVYQNNFGSTQSYKSQRAYIHRAMGLGRVTIA